MLLTAAAKAAGQQHPLTPFSANPSWQQGQKGGESKGGDHPEIRKIKGDSGEKKTKREIGQKLLVDSKGMGGFSTPNSQRTSMCG
jgi:hypothetical protein